MVRTCQRLLKSLACQSATDILTHGFCKAKSRLQLRDKLPSQTDDSLEDVLITISHKQSVVDAVNELKESDFDFEEPKSWNKFMGPVLDVCAYNPRSREWYYLYSLNDERAASTIIRSTSWEPWEYVCIGDRICCAAHNDTYKSPAYKLKLEDFSVDCISYHRDEDDLLGGFKPEYTRILATKESVYSLSLDTEISEGDFIECRKFTCCDIFNANDPAERDGHVFSVKNEKGMTCKHTASLSPYCNEMLIVMGHNRAEAAYVVDLNSLEPTTTDISTFEIKDEHKSKKRMVCWIEVVVGKDRFYVVEVTKEAGQRYFKVSCSYEYEYGSLFLTMKEAFSMFVPYNILAPWVLTPPDPPLVHEHVFQHRGSAWIFTGNERDTSSLFEIFEETAGKLGFREHTPPPFPYIIGAFSAQLSHSFLENKGRVIKYILPK